MALEYETEEDDAHGGYRRLSNEEEGCCCTGGAGRGGLRGAVVGCTVCGEGFADLMTDVIDHDYDIAVCRNGHVLL